MVIKPDFYQRDDVVEIARDLLGTLLCTKDGEGRITKAMITEVEAYNGTSDKACHAYGGRRTERTEAMYKPGGTAYVYLCYGIHYLFNVVVSHSEDPKAVLVRSVEPVSGGGVMLIRRNPSGRIDKSLTNGPGKLTEALGINISDNGLVLDSGRIWIEHHREEEMRSRIVSRPRIGVDYAGEDAALPYRFYIEGNPYVSKL